MPFFCPLAAPVCRPAARWPHPALFGCLITGWVGNFTQGYGRQQARKQMSGGLARAAILRCPPGTASGGGGGPAWLVRRAHRSCTVAAPGECLSGIWCFQDGRVRM